MRVLWVGIGAADGGGGEGAEERGGGPAPARQRGLEGDTGRSSYHCRWGMLRNTLTLCSVAEVPRVAGRTKSFGDAHGARATVDGIRRAAARITALRDMLSGECGLNRVSSEE